MKSHRFLVGFLAMHRRSGSLALAIRFFRDVIAELRLTSSATLALERKWREFHEYDCDLDEGWKACENYADDDTLGTLSIRAWSQRRHSEPVAWFHLDPTAHEPTAYFERFLWPHLPEFVEPIDGTRILTVSIRDDCAAAAERFRTCDALFEGVHRLFSQVSAVYGYCGHRACPITDRYNVTTGALRICDIDYRTSIDGIYENNLLTDAHVQRLPRADLLKDLSLQRKAAFDDNGFGGSLLIRIDKGERRLIELAHRALGPLMPQEESVPSGSYWLISASQAQQIGRRRLDSCSVARDVTGLPDGSVVIREAPVVANEDLLKRTRALSDLYVDLLGSAHDQDAWAHEYSVQHRGILDKLACFQRIPTGNLMWGVCTEVFLNEPVDPNTVYLQFLSTDHQDPGSTFLQGVIADWTHTTSQHPEVYGEIAVLGPLTTAIQRDRVLRYLACDLSAATEHAVSTLLCLLDDRTHRESFVRLLVVGALLPWRERELSEPRSNG